MVKRIITSTSFLIFADDTKLFRSIDNPCDSIALQQDLETFVMWCNLVAFRVNIGNCNVINFYKKQYTQCNYFNSSGVLIRKDQDRDLGVIYDSKFTFIPHITAIVRKANNKLSCIMRNTKEFKTGKTYSQLYLSLVHICILL